VTAALEHAVDPDLDEPAPVGRRPFVSVVVPAYNEALILMQSLSTLYDYLIALSDEYEWEIVVVNDGSQDETGDIADAFAKARPEVRVLHHAVNFRLGQALRYAFNTCRGDYVVTIDCDLSYAPEHIGLLLRRLREDHAKIAVASPYMKGGHTTGIPFSRRILSRGANRFLSAASGGNLSTLTGMVRAYDRPFLSSLSLRAMGTDINTEILYKAQLLNARVVEVPAHLDWSAQQAAPERESKMQIGRSTSAYAFSGFMFRPVAFFIVPGLIILAFALYNLGWLAYNILDEYGNLSGAFEPRMSEAFANTFDIRPHAYFVSGFTLVIAVQLLSLGIMASQSKRYFEELFHVSTATYKEQQRVRGW
jgi:glycosyltransferase involved in cell wall biosynthesis